ncbi:metalloendopeptidase [Sphingomonas crocodyli]|uniref:Metalloendopeptidase n=1 Tax=Sphingomonas crocodyli TaxID=1979270 RepID=A0A437M4F0_9SPHN|nr:metalloendopeptidase [Sphingomonas crocodyli]
MLIIVRARALLAGALAPILLSAADPTVVAQRRALVTAQASARAAEHRATDLDRQAKAMGKAAERSQADQVAAAAAIQAAEARIEAAKGRVALIDRLRAIQRARLAERQGPVVRLTAALQTMARRPAALALVQPGSVDDMIHVRALLGSTLPVIRERTAGLRAEVARADALRRRADAAVAELRHDREQLAIRRTALARLEAVQRQQQQGLVDDAMAQQDRVLAMGERAHDIAQLIETLGEQSDVRDRLMNLSGPILRPNVPGQVATAPDTLMQAGVTAAPPYRLPVIGRLVSGMGEVGDSGVRARGITLSTARAAQVVAPAAGRIAYAGPFRGYKGIVIIDHNDGWATLVTGLRVAAIRPGLSVLQGSPLGTADGADPRITVELRHAGSPVDIVPLLAR